MKYLANDISQHRNWTDEKNRSESIQSEVTIRKITDDELKKFENFKPESKEATKWSYRG